jgi:HD-GYP domain-containing protein (c-di-GMP phosphodiesterase class II)
MDGVALLGEIRSRWPDTAVIMLTAISEVDTAVACLQKGAFDYITKPFQIGEIGARIGQALERRRLVQENAVYHERLAELVQDQSHRIERAYLEGIQSLVHALEAKDRYTYGHSARVSTYSGWVADVLGLPAERCALLKLGAELHDAGKIGIRESVLLKPDILTADEYDHIKSHTVIGEHILGPFLRDAPEILEIVRSHHERIDGRGFPDGLEGDRIPPLVRIVAVVDTFDAMTSGRPYRGARKVEQALAELRSCRGSQFDGEAVDAFLVAAADAPEFPVRTPERLLHLLPDTLAPPPIPEPPAGIHE